MAAAAAAGSELDLDQWLPWVAPLTFATTSLPLTAGDAKLICKAYELRRNGVKPELDEEVRGPLQELAQRIDGPVRAGGSGAFVRLSKRSGKDAANGDTRLAAQYVQERAAYLAEEPEATLAMADMIAIVRSIGAMLKVESGQEAVMQLSSSQRIFTDLTMAILTQGDSFKTEIHVRAFTPILGELEFRSFVCGGKLAAITQYLSICYVPRIAREKEKLVASMQEYFTTQVAPRVPIQEYVVDFAFLRDGSIRVIELNPFSRATNAGLFDWEKDGDVLHGRKPFEARIVKTFDPSCVLRLSATIATTLASVRADVPPPPPPPAQSSTETPPEQQPPSRTCILQ